MKINKIALVLMASVGVIDASLIPTKYPIDISGMVKQSNPSNNGNYRDVKIAWPAI